MHMRARVRVYSIYVAFIISFKKLNNFDLDYIRNVIESVSVVLISCR